MSRPDRPLALITGASRGIGRAIALALAPDHELLLSARSEAALEGTCAALEAAGYDARRAPVDLGERAARRAWLERLASEPISVLVNNAGVAPSAPLAKTDDATLASTLEIDLVAPFELCRRFAPGMAQRGFGRIVNVASTAALKGYAYTAAYSSAKAGLLGLTRALAVELAKKGVTVNAVCPGFVDTDIVRHAVDNIVAKTGQDAARARATLSAFSPQGRLVRPEEVAAAVAYLCSANADAVSGLALAIDGAETA